MDLARSSTGQMVSGDPFLARVHSTNSGEFRSRTIFGRQRSAHGVQASVIERAERIVRLAGEFREGQKQSGMVLE